MALADDIPTLNRRSHAQEGDSFDEKKSSQASVVKDVKDAYSDLEKTEVLEIPPEETEAVVHDAADIATQILHTDDDPTLPAMTFRFWFLGLGLATFGSVLSEIYWWKPQNATVSALFQLIISYVLGRAMAQFIPTKGWFRYLNPGPFNIKEHACIVIFSSTASTTADAISIISTLDLFYGVKLHPAVAIFQTLSSQLLGYGFAGILRVLLVFPTYALYPATVPQVNLLQSMHTGNYLSKKKMRFFWIVFTAIFCWEIIPTWMFPLLTAFSIVCLADHGKHDFVRNFFGGGSSNEGIGFFSFGFDWTLISQGNPLYWPLQTQISAYLGMFGGYILLTSAYYSDLWSGKSLGLPWMSQSLFYANGTTYDQTTILNDKQEFDPEKYAQVGQPWLTTTYGLSLLCYNLAVGASFSHVLVWHWKELKAAFSGFKFLRNVRDVDDPHFAKMKVYPEVPQLWYISILLGSFAVGCGTLYTHTNYLPGWSMLVFVIISFVITTFLGFVTAVTGFSQPTQGLVQLIAAYVHPGKPVANMYAKLYGYSTGYQALYLLQDLKLGQYCKIPPRATFTAQIAGTVVGSIMNYVLMKSIISAHRAELVDPIGTRLWSGWHAQSFNTQAITWGALAKQMYSPHSTYFWIPMAILIGFLTPFVFFGLHKVFGKKTGFFKYIIIPVVANYLGYLPYSVNGQWWTCYVIGIASQWWARTRRPRWFKKYNYLMSAALDGGSQIIFFILNFAVFGASGSGVDFPSWWGNPSASSGLSVDRCKATVG
ncbi:OPT oligopeptide transporter [Gloeophyllum trabeum ATCC 11539]|uniref:OPT oligopeptide transporter n=1 Tax=Gloeophyllum trabeum (strain ATCC 11539 / FP-39264 / Madison 617) TaxID=670483 RepID=S7PZM2_GLOTA|nr:OPT oligopeptide transporter [Gloeophyllum trabeum ATCC 11539]EPQ52747.1 OPT oligopeptide transporter [Gloeophyllum trabeum ATCC 11539]